MNNYKSHKYILEKLHMNQQWFIKLLGYYAEYKIMGAHDHINGKPPKPIMIPSGDLCNDKRRVPTIRKYFEARNLIVSSWSSNNIFTVIDEKAEKLLQDYMKKPTFNTSGFIKKKSDTYPYDEEDFPVSDLNQVYRSVEHLNAYELIYVYLHQDTYDFKMFKIKGGHTYYYKLKLFPISAIEGMSETACVSQSKHFAKICAKEILTETLGIKFKAIHDDKPYLNKKELDERIKIVDEKMRLLQRTFKELKIIQRKIERMGEDTFQKTILDTSLEYIKRQSPIWVYGNNKDKETIAKLVLKGVGCTTEY